MVSCSVAQEPVSEPPKRDISAALRCTLDYGQVKVCEHQALFVPNYPKDSSTALSDGRDTEVQRNPWRGTNEYFVHVMT